MSSFGKRLPGRLGERDLAGDEIFRTGYSGVSLQRGGRHDDLHQSVRLWSRHAGSAKRTDRASRGQVGGCDAHGRTGADLISFSGKLPGGCERR